jgi:hypothetical protein
MYFPLITNYKVQITSIKTAPASAYVFNLSFFFPPRKLNKSEPLAKVIDNEMNGSRKHMMRLSPPAGKRAPKVMHHH